MTAKKATKKATAKLTGKATTKTPLVASVGTVLIDDGGEAPLNMFAMQPSDATRVEIYRWMPEKGSYAFHGRISLEDATSSFISDAFGGGRYQLKTQTRDDAGKWRWGKVASIELPGPYVPPTELPSLSQKGRAATETGTAVAVVSGGGKMSEIREMFDMTLAAKMVDAMKPQPSPFTPFIAPLLGFLGPIVAKMMERSPSVPPEITIALTEMKAALERERGQQSTSGGIRETMETMALVTEMQDLLRGGTDQTNQAPKGDDMMGRMERILGMIMQRGQQVPALPPGTDGPPQDGEQTAMLEWQRLLIDQSSMLVNAARRDMAPESVADLIEAFLPREQQGAMVELLTIADPKAAIIGVIPEMASYQSWLDEVVTLLKGFYLRTEGDGDDNK